MTRCYHIIPLAIITGMLSCNRQHEMEGRSDRCNPAEDLYRVKLSEYDGLRLKAVNDKDMKAANMLANHFLFAEPNDKLYDYWMAVTARNGSEAAAEVFLRRGTTFNQILENHKEDNVNTGGDLSPLNGEMRSDAK